MPNQKKTWIDELVDQATHPIEHMFGICDCPPETPPSESRTADTDNRRQDADSDSSSVNDRHDDYYSDDSDSDSDDNSAPTSRGAPRPQDVPRRLTEAEMRVSRITDQDELTRIAKYDSDIDMRRAALARVTDQDVLISIVKFGSDIDMRKAALARVTDQDVLTYIAKYDSDIDMRRAAEDALN